MTLVKATYHHKDLRNALIEETLAVLAEGGFATLTLRELARRLGVTHAAPYAHFADKRALLEAVAIVGFERLAEALEPIRATNLPAETKIVEMSRAYLRFAQAQPNLYRLMFVAHEITEDRECVGLQEAGQRAIATLIDTIAELESARSDDAADLQDKAMAAWALVHGAAMLTIDERTALKSERSPDEIVQMAAAIFVKGLGASKG